MLQKISVLSAVVGALVGGGFVAVAADDRGHLRNPVLTAVIVHPAVASPTDTTSIISPVEPPSCSSYVYVVLPTNVTTSVAVEVPPTTETLLNAILPPDTVHASSASWDWIRVEPCGPGLPEEHFILVPSIRYLRPPASSIYTSLIPTGFHRCRSSDGARM